MLPELRQHPEVKKASRVFVEFDAGIAVPDVERTHNGIVKGALYCLYRGQMRRCLVVGDMIYGSHVYRHSI